jgi:hypothetical protein
MDDQSVRDLVAACGEALIKVPATGLKSASYSTGLFSPGLFVPSFPPICLLTIIISYDILKKVRKIITMRHTHADRYHL